MGQKTTIRYVESQHPPTSGQGAGLKRHSGQQCMGLTCQESRCVENAVERKLKEAKEAKHPEMKRKGHFRRGLLWKYLGLKSDLVFNHFKVAHWEISHLRTWAPKNSPRGLCTHLSFIRFCIFKLLEISIKMLPIMKQPTFPFPSLHIQTFILIRYCLQAHPRSLFCFFYLKSICSTTRCGGQQFWPGSQLWFPPGPASHWHGFFYGQSELQR